MTVGKIPAGLLLALLFASSSAVAQEPARQREPRVERQLRIDGLHRRWTGLPDGERQRLERHLDELDRLPAEGRHELLERARALREAELALREAMPRELRHELETLGPDEGRERWRRHVRDCLRMRGRALRERLPHELRERIEHGPPEARSHVRWKLERGRERMRAPELQRLARELGIDSRRVRRAAELSQAARRHVDRDLERRAEREERP